MDFHYFIHYSHNFDILRRISWATRHSFNLAEYPCRFLAPCPTTSQSCVWKDAERYVTVYVQLVKGRLRNISQNMFTSLFFFSIRSVSPGVAFSAPLSARLPLAFFSGESFCCFDLRESGRLPLYEASAGCAWTQCAISTYSHTILATVWRVLGLRGEGLFSP